MKKMFAVAVMMALVSISCGFIPFGSKNPTQSPLRITSFPQLPPKIADGATQEPVLTDTPEYLISLDTRTPTVAFAATGWCVPGSSREIFVMVPNGTWIKCISKSRGDDYDPNWSPDGKTIVFISDRTGNNEIFLMNADGSEQTQLTFSQEDEHFPAFSPDGDRIVYEAELENKTLLYVINIDGSEQHQIVFPGEDEYNCKYPDWSPDGEWLVISCFGSDMETGIFIAHPDGSDLKLVKSGSLHNPVWSPDGEWIAFDGEPAGCKFEVYIMTRDGSGMKQVTENPEGCGGYNKHPAWSPDGTRLIFNSQRNYPEGQGYELFSINLDGTGETQLTDSSQVELYRSPYNAVWSHVKE